MTALEDLVVHEETSNGDVKLHYVRAGDGPLVVLLHGFPEFWYSWRHQIPALAEAGFNAVAPDLRGYGMSDKPAGLDRYRADDLVGDVAAVLAHAGAERATIVGHDWGGVVAWLTAMRRPDLVERLVVLNSPHPARFAEALRSPAQVLRSSYMAFFNLPVLPELVLRANRLALLRWMLRSNAVRPDAFPDAVLDRYVEAYDEPGALSGALALYRAFGRSVLTRRGARGTSEQPRGSRRVEAPTLVIWGADDLVLPPALADPGPRVPDRRIELVESAGHFVHADAPHRVNELLLDVLRAQP